MDRLEQNIGDEDLFVVLVFLFMLFTLAPENCVDLSA